MQAKLNAGPVMRAARGADRVTGREHEAAKGGYGLTGNDILKTASESTLSVR